MLKIAFFVEGLTEQIFVKKLLVEIFGEKHISFEIKQMRGGSTSAVKFTLIEAQTCNPDEKKWDFLIYECGGDSTIKSYILDQRQSLIKAGYTKIIGIRDVHPLLHADIINLQNGLNYGTPQKYVTIKFILCIMEIESWFLAECTHFEKISNKLTNTLIQAELGFNPCSENESRINPSVDLDNIYRLAGLRYKKKNNTISLTVNSLDYSLIYLQLPDSVASLKLLTDELDSLFV